MSCACSDAYNHSISLYNAPMHSPDISAAWLPVCCTWHIAVFYWCHNHAPPAHPDTMASIPFKSVCSWGCNCIADLVKHGFCCTFFRLDMSGMTRHLAPVQVWIVGSRRQWRSCITIKVDFWVLCSVMFMVVSFLINVMMHSPRVSGGWYINTTMWQHKHKCNCTMSNYGHTKWNTQTRINTITHIQPHIQTRHTKHEHCNNTNNILHIQFCNTRQDTTTHTLHTETCNNVDDTTHANNTIPK